VCKTRPDGLNESGILAALWRESDPTRDNRRRAVVQSSECHHHRREAFIAGRNAHHGLARWQGTGKPTEDNRGIVAVGKRIEHPGRALRAAITWVADKTRKRSSTLLTEPDGCSLYLETNLPVSGVVAKGDGLAIVVAQATEGGEDEIFILCDGARLPAHPDILREAKQVPARPV
jgi:hypothetical protein